MWLLLRKVLSEIRRALCLYPEMIRKAMFSHLFLRQNFAHILLSIVLDMSPIHAWKHNWAVGFGLSSAIHKNP